MNNEERKNLTEDRTGGINSPSFCRWPCGRDKKRPMADLTYFNYRYSVDNYLPITNHGYVLDELAPYATLSREDAQSLRTGLQGTPLENVFLDLPEDIDISINDFFERVDRHFCGREGSISVNKGFGMSRKIEGEVRTDGKYHLGWQGRAISYQLAAIQAVPDLPVSDLDDLSVEFTPHIRNGRQFLLEEGMWDIIDRKPVMKNGTLYRHVGGVFVGCRQFRVCELTGKDVWRQRDVLALLQVGQYMPILGALEGDEDVLQYVSVILGKPLPAEYFDMRRKEGFSGDGWQKIYAPFPQDLSPPKDLPIVLCEE